MRWNRRFCRKMLRFFTSIATDYAAGGEVSAESDDSWKQSEQGFVFFDNIQFLSPRARKRVLEYLQSPSRKYAVAVSCTDKEQLSDEFLAEFSVQLQLPTLSERPLRERMEMIKHLFPKRLCGYRDR
ncbi:MAG: hypothetical protein ACLVGL_17740 [Waltera sp.]